MNVSVSQYNITFSKNKAKYFGYKLLAITRRNYKNKKGGDFTTIFQVWDLNLYKLKYTYNVKNIN